MQAATTEDCTSISFCKTHSTEVLSKHLQQTQNHCRCLNFFFYMFICRRFFSTLTSLTPTFNSSSPMDKAMTIRSSACSSSYSPPVQNPLDIISSRLIERSGLDEHLVRYQTPLYTQLQLLPVPSPWASILKSSVFVWATLNE